MLRILRVTKFPGCVGIRNCSQNTNPSDRFNTSNIGFPKFSTKGTKSTDFTGYTSGPNLKVFMNLAFKRTPVTRKDLLDLIEGSLYGIENVTKILASDSDLFVSDLSKNMTPDCFEKVANILSTSSEDAKTHLYIPKEDVFLGECIRVLSKRRRW